MKPKTLTRLLAAGGLGGIAAVHWIPRHFLPFGSRLFTSVLITGVLLAVHRHPLNSLARDTAKALEGNLKEQKAVEGGSGSRGAVVETI